MIPRQLLRHIPLLRRLFFQRDQAMQERDLAILERNALAAERDRLLQELSSPPKNSEQAKFDQQIAAIRHHPAEIASGVGSVTQLVDVPDDTDLVRRIVHAYGIATQTSVGSKNSFWLTDIAAFRRPEHETLLTGDIPAVQAMLRDPVTNSLFYGFDNLTEKTANLSDAWAAFQGQFCYDSLLALAEAVGTVKLPYPEAPPKLDSPEGETLLLELDRVFGFRVDFPNPYPGEVGFMTSRGVASYRAVQALYQAWLISKAVSFGRVMEIGGGLGRTAYYASRFGLRDYTIIDLPLTGVAQAYFLFRVGLDVRLYGETTSKVGVRVEPPAVFYESSDRYDLIVNVDSFTEMAPETARDYFDEAAHRSSRLLSINHEYNPHRMFDIIRDHPAVTNFTRELYWLRRGYVQEMVTFQKPE